MKYMLMMHTPSGGPYQIARWPQQDIHAHIAFMKDFAKALQESGELVVAEGLAGPDQAKRVRAGSDGKPVTDGVFPEAKEFLAGYWILALYGLLLQMSDNPMVALNHAIATAMVRGPAAGLERLDALAHDARLAEHHRLDAVRGHLLERAGDRAAAQDHYRRAADRTTSVPERDYLRMKAARLDGEPR
jgi:predicted RNA polymerase sigma factor